MNEPRATGLAHSVTNVSTGATTVLVVDDDSSVRESLRLVLEDRYRVVTASSGTEALERMREEPIAVVLLDLTMPGIGGVETLAKIREIDESLEVVIVTGYGSYQSAVDTLRLRAFDYLTKPLDGERVLTIVQRAADSHRQRQSGTRADRIPMLTRRLLELLDALYLERPPGLGESFFVKLDYLRLLAQSLRDGTGDTTRMASQLAAEVMGLGALVPSGAGEAIGRVLERMRGLATSIRGA